MNKQIAIIVLILITLATIFLSFNQPTVIHQLVSLVAGGVAILVALSIFVVSNWPKAQAANEEEPKNADEILIERVNGLRNFKYSDEYIADSLNADIDVIKAIPR